MPEKEIGIRKLEKTDDRSGFRSGDIELDRFFQRYAGQNQFRHYIGTTYVAVFEQRIIGFVTVATGELTAERIAGTVKKGLPAYPLPVLRIARLAVEHQFQSLGIGRKLLATMFRLAVEIREKAACAGVVVDAKEAAIPFYTKLGFMSLQSIRGELGDLPQLMPMFLPIQHIEKAL